MLQIFVKSSVAHHAIVWANFGGSGSIPGPEFSTQTYQMAKFIGAEGKNCPRQTLNIIFDLKVAAAVVVVAVAVAPIPCFVIHLKNVSSAA